MIVKLAKLENFERITISISFNNRDTSPNLFLPSSSIWTSACNAIPVGRIKIDFTFIISPANLSLINFSILSDTFESSQESTNINEDFFNDKYDMENI